MPGKGPKGKSPLIGSIIAKRSGKVVRSGWVPLSEHPAVWRIVTDPKRRAEDRLGRTLRRIRKKHGEDVIGFTVWTRLPGVLYAHGGYVSPEMRGKGVDRKMEAELEKIAGERGISRIGFTSAAMPRHVLERRGYKAHSMFHPYSIIGWFGRFYSKKVEG